MFSCEIWEIFKNTYFDEHLQTTASLVSQFRSSDAFRISFIQFISAQSSITELLKIISVGVAAIFSCIEPLLFHNS